MTHPPEDTPPPADPDDPAPAALRGAIGWGGGAVVAVTVAALLARFLFRGHPAVAGWAVPAVLAAAALGGVAWAARQQYRLWAIPVRRLAQVVEGVRQGELPLEELSRVAGVPGPLVPAVRELLLDLRRHRQVVQQLELEMSQRVANRTDALERALGGLREKASRDPLTGLHNRRMLDETLPGLVARHAADGRPLAVLMVDVDHFKLLNDTLGHPAGDDLLRSIGQIVRSTARDRDLAFRCGGDEFVVVMPDADPDAARALADRLTSLVDALAKPLRLEKRPRLSIGVAGLGDAPEPTAAAVLATADQVLYAVKRERKTRGAAGPPARLPVPIHAG